MSNTLVCPHCGARMSDAPLEPTLSERLQGGGAKKKTRDERNPMSAWTGSRRTARRGRL